MMKGRPRIARLALALALLGVGAGAAGPAGPAYAAEDAPRCFERAAQAYDERGFGARGLAARTPGGTPYDHILFHFAARHFSDPICGAYRPDEAATLYSLLLQYNGWALEAFHYRELLRREPRLRAERAAPSDALLFRVIALNSDRTEPPEAAWAELAERFAPEDPPAGAKQALADELARPVSDSMAALLADARDEPLLQGVARLRCFYMDMSRLFSPAVRLDCARLGYRVAERTPFADAWGELRRAANIELNVLGSEGYGPALLFGAERHLQERGMKPLRWAFEWLLLAERAGAETEPLMSHVKGRLDPREIEAATLNVRTLGIPPPLR